MEITVLTLSQNSSVTLSKVLDTTRLSVMGMVQSQRESIMENEKTVVVGMP